MTEDEIRNKLVSKYLEDIRNGRDASTIITELVAEIVRLRGAGPMINPYNPLVSRLYLDNGLLKEEIRSLNKENERLHAELDRLRALLDDHVSTGRDDEEPPKEGRASYILLKGHPAVLRDDDGPLRGVRIP